MKALCKLGVLFGLALAVALANASPAHALFKIRITDGIATRTVTDNVVLDSAGGTGDLNALTAGSILYSNGTSFAGFSVVVATGTSQPLAPNSVTIAFMDIMLTVTYSGAVPKTLTVDITDTDFNLAYLPGPAGFKSSASNNSSAGITETYESYVNYGALGNKEFAMDGVTGITFDGGLQGPIAPGGNSTIGAIINPLSNPFSISARTVLTFGAIGTASIDNNTTVTTPAPAGILLALSGAPMLLGYWLRRRQSRIVSIA